jgi:hypothetical protein
VLDKLRPNTTGVEDMLYVCGKVINFKERLRLDRFQRGPTLLSTIIEIYR